MEPTGGIIHGFDWISPSNSSRLPQFYQMYLLYFLHNDKLLIVATVLQESCVIADFAIEIQLLDRNAGDNEAR